MALRFIDSFDTYGPLGTKAPDLLDAMSGKWDAINDYGTYDLEIVTGSSGGRGLKQYLSYASKYFDNQQTWVIGFWVKFVSVHSSGNVFLRVGDEGTNQVYLEIESDMQIDVYTGGVNRGSSGTLSLETWYHIELYTEIRNSATGYYELRIDDVPVVWGLADTSTSGNDYAQEISIESRVSEVHFDDVYIADGTPGINFFVGLSKVSVVYPTSDSAPSAWTPSTGTDHYATVNDVVRDPSTYVYTNTNGLEDIYRFPLPNTGGSIYGVQFSVEGASNGTEAKEIQALIRAGANESTTQRHILGGANTPDTLVVIADYVIGTSTPWTAVSISTTDFGCKKVS